MNIVHSKIRNKFSVRSVEAILQIRYGLSLQGSSCVDFIPTEDMLKNFFAKAEEKTQENQDIDYWSELREGMNKTGSTETKSCDRPDLVSRIFKLKVDSLIEDLTHKHIFGRVKAYLYSIEWQKRGLPHVHVLLWMEERVTADIVSQLISAEIPDKEKEPRLYDVVTKCMIHGPCKGYDESHLCCQGKHSRAQKCGKGFPKTCRNDLLFGNNGYPEYKRRSIGEGGNSFEIKIKDEKKTINNSWVVPYNAYMCLKYNAHVNVECSNSIKCIAYVTKYVNKGCDRILFTKTSDNGDVNEVENYQEATWKILKFDIHKKYPPVTTLDLHLEGENEVFYNDNTSEEEMKKKMNKDTQLTAFFKLCSNNSFAADLHYHEVPRHFIYNANTSSWEERKGRTFPLGRIRAVTTKTVELFYLRLLLTHKPVPTSYEDLRTIDGKMYPSNREAVKALGLLADEETWNNTILEIINHTNDRKQLRETYASMLVFSDLEDQSGIWEETKDLFASDYLHINNLTEYNDEIYLDALDDIQKHVWNCGGGSITEYGLPPSRGGEKTSNVVRRERSYNKEKLKEEVAFWTSVQEQWNLCECCRGHCEGPVEFDEDFGVRVKCRQELVDTVYDDIENNHQNASYFEKRAIASPTNDDVDNINQMIHEKLKEKEVVYNSVDVAVEEGTDIQTSVFNAMTSPSLPPHQLRVKVGGVLMIIRNICPPKLCNGTRIIVTNLKKNVLVGKILGGSYRGEQVMIPRITLEAQDTPVHFKQLFVEATPSPQVEPPAVVASGETSAIAEEEPEFGIREIPKEIYNISEDAVKMILPDFVFNDDKDNDPDESDSETVTLKKEMKDIISVLRKLTKNQEKFIEEIKDVVKRQSDDEDSTPSPPRKKIKVNDSIVVADEK
ncbi:uncharacterized protein LOC143022806 [Oratosquilla oratoria]|uniref:uncharacterized protein LOC143022806 n=1 Tax=Oratosquilla oratoria TaxID=337810 RepID=UPI003F763A31